MCIYIYIYIHIYIHTCVYIYIYVYTQQINISARTPPCWPTTISMIVIISVNIIILIIIISSSSSNRSASLVHLRGHLRAGLRCARGPRRRREAQDRPLYYSMVYKYDNYANIHMTI